MEKLITKFAAALLLVFTLSHSNAHAMLPKPIKTTGTVVFVDHETRSVVVKLEKKGEKPIVFDWNTVTAFIKDEKPASAADLKEGSKAVIHFKRLSFRNPILKKLIWEGKTE